MTTRLEAVEALTQRFASTWGTTYPYTLVGSDFTPPRRGIWARFTVVPTADTQNTLGSAGNRKFARQGRAITQVFGPTGQGSKTLRQLAQAVADGFEGVSLSGTTIHTQAVTVSGPSVDDAWLQMTVDAPFTFYETR